ncbi:hypothetical protein SteCoe_1436 [Stentor coeruleus]|uniref:NAD(P)(+)--arginine ADP-ribosyltransferase n=1 Tax=Stentor coeruleus TaxID=5963 RepID=A0A1R2D1T3_9CILI|nr:hypothetical protein SteCoe_1436 [Stentor coeruleus]
MELFEIEFPFLGTLELQFQESILSHCVFKALDSRLISLKAYGFNSHVLVSLKMLPINVFKKSIKLDLKSNTLTFLKGLKGGTTLAGDAVNIIWYDRNAFNEENTNYFETIPSGYYIKRFSELNEAKTYIEYFRNNKNILLTSGSSGEEILKSFNNDYIKAALIFCFDVEGHKKWARNFPKVVLVHNNFNRILKKAMRYAVSTRDRFDHTELDQKSYWHFKNIIQKFIDANFHLNRQNITDEITCLNMDYKDNIRSLINDKENDLMDSIIYLYSTDLMYHEFNKAYKTNQLHRVLFSSAFCIREIDLYGESREYYCKEKYLYRGIKSKDYINFEAAYQHKVPLFLPGFISTSRDKQVAKKFADGGIVMQICLNPKKPHPHILIENLSEFTKEHEVLIMPYLPLYVQMIYPSENIVLLHQFSYISLEVNSPKFGCRLIENIEEFIQIKELKKKLKKYFELKAKDMLLDYDFVLLENEKCIQDYNIKDGCRLYLRLGSVYMQETYTDRLFEIQYKGNETIQDLKNRLKEIHYISNCAFVNNEITMFSTKRAYKYYSINDGDTFSIYRSLSKVKLTISVQRFNFEKHYFSIGHDDTVKTLIHLIEDKFEISRSEFKLIFRNKIIEMSNFFLKGIFIEENSTLILYDNLCNPTQEAIKYLLENELRTKMNIRVFNKDIYLVHIGLFHRIEKLIEHIKTNLKISNIILEYDGTFLNPALRLIDYKVKGKNLIEVHSAEGIKVFDREKNKTYIFNFNSNKTVGDLKKLISEKIEISQEYIKLFVSNNELVDEAYINSLNKNLEIELLVIKKISLNIFMTQGEPFIVHVMESGTIEDIKIEISISKGFPIEKQCLSYNHELLVTSYLIKYYNIENNSNIFLTISEFENYLNYDSPPPPFKIIKDIFPKKINELDQKIKQFSDTTRILNLSIQNLSSCINLDSRRNIKDKEKNYIDINKEFSNHKNAISGNLTSSYSQDININITKNINLIQIQSGFTIKVKNIDQDCETFNSETFSLEALKYFISEKFNYTPSIQRIYAFKKLISKLDPSVLPKEFTAYIDINCMICDKNTDTTCLRNCMNDIFACHNCFYALMNKKCCICGKIDIRNLIYIQKYYCEDHFIKIMKCSKCNACKENVEYYIEENTKYCDECAISRSLNKDPYRIKFSIQYPKKNKNKIVKIVEMGNKYIFVSTFAGKIKMYYPKFNDVHLVKKIRSNECNVMKALPGNKFLLYGGSDGMLFFFDIESMSKVLFEKVTDTEISVIEATNEAIIIGSQDNKIFLLDFTTFSVLMAFEGHENSISCLALSNDNISLFSGSYDTTIKKWSLATFELVQTFSKHKNSITCILVSVPYIISSSVDKKIIIWSNDSGHAIRVIRAHKNEITALAFIGNYLVSSSHDKNIKFWSCTDIDEKLKITENGMVNCLEVSKNGKFFYYATSSNEVKILKIWMTD